MENEIEKLKKQIEELAKRAFDLYASCYDSPTSAEDAAKKAIQKAEWRAVEKKKDYLSRLLTERLVDTI